jgi:hypothetical protein
MITILLADDTPPWFGACRHFNDGAAAKQAFERVFNHDDQGSLGVGVYRHQRVGFDAEAVLVSVIGLDQEGVSKAEELLGGEETELHPETWYELIRRRLQQVLALDAAGKDPGRYRIPHSEGGDQLA